MLGLSCSFDLYGTTTPTQPAQVTSSPEPVVENTQTPLPEATLPGALQFFTEEFNTATDDWKYLTVNGGNSRVVDGIVGLMSIRQVGGLLSFDLQGPGAWIYATYDPFTYKNVRLDVKAGNRGSNSNNISLICRKSDLGWYEFDIASNGLFEILFAQIQPDASVSYKHIADGGASKVKSGMAENEYGIVCQDNTLSLYVNGSEVRKLEENKYLLPEGRVGVSVSSFREVPVTVDFFWVKISQP